MNRRILVLHRNGVGMDIHVGPLRLCRGQSCWADILIPQNHHTGPSSQLSSNLLHLMLISSHHSTYHCSTEQYRLSIHNPPFRRRSHFLLKLTALLPPLDRIRVVVAHHPHPWWNTAEPEQTVQKHHAVLVIIVGELRTGVHLIPAFGQLLDLIDILDRRSCSADRATLPSHHDRLQSQRARQCRPAKFWSTIEVCAHVFHAVVEAVELLGDLAVDAEEWRTLVVADVGFDDLERLANHLFDVMLTTFLPLDQWSSGRLCCGALVVVRGTGEGGLCECLRFCPLLAPVQLSIWLRGSS